RHVLGRLRQSRHRVSSALKLSRHLGREIGAIAIDPLTKGEAHEARYPNRSTGCLRCSLDHQGYLGLLVDDKDLLQQNNLLVELAQPPIYHPLNDVVRPT